MKVKFFLILPVMLALVAGCSDELESGKSYPALEMGDATVVYKIDKVIQNEVDVKPFLSGLFDNIELTLSYKDNKPYLITFAETKAPFRIKSQNYTDKLEFEWEINTASTPYKILDKKTGELFGSINRERAVTISFLLGCSSNQYEYIFVPVNL